MRSHITGGVCVNDVPAFGNLAVCLRLGKYLDDVVTVSEEGIIEAMRCVWERMKIVVEPSAVVPLGALLTGRLGAAGKRVGIVLSGGNVDLDRLARLISEETGSAPL